MCVLSLNTVDELAETVFTPVVQDHAAKLAENIASAKSTSQAANS